MLLGLLRVCEKNGEKGRSGREKEKGEKRERKEWERERRKRERDQGKERNEKRDTESGERREKERELKRKREKARKIKWKKHKRGDIDAVLPVGNCRDQRNTQLLSLATEYRDKFNDFISGPDRHVGKNVATSINGHRVRIISMVNVQH